MREGASDGSLNPNIRPATKYDLESLYNLEDICYKEETFPRKRVKYLLLKAKSKVFISIIDDKTIGSMIILLRKHIFNARIYSLNVHPEYRRKGIASSLMDHALDILRENGYKKVTLEVGINNMAAQNLYRSKNFAVDKILYNYYRNGDDALHLIRNL